MVYPCIGLMFHNITTDNSTLKLMILTKVMFPLLLTQDLVMLTFMSALKTISQPRLTILGAVIDTARIQFSLSQMILLLRERNYSVFPFMVIKKATTSLFLQCNPTLLSLF